jgi:hypothetical protein
MGLLKRLFRNLFTRRGIVEASFIYFLPIITIDGITEGNIMAGFSTRGKRKLG